MDIYLIGCACIALLMFTLGVRMNQEPGLRTSFLRYRTKSSLRNDETWVFANLFAGRCLMILSVIVLVILVLSETLLLQHPTRMYITLVVSLLMEIILTFVLTERKMKAVFFKDGKRKPNSY